MVNRALDKDQEDLGCSCCSPTPLPTLVGKPFELPRLRQEPLGERWGVVSVRCLERCRGALNPRKQSFRVSAGQRECVHLQSVGARRYVWGLGEGGLKSLPKSDETDTLYSHVCFPVAQMVKNLPAMQETRV